MNQPFVKVETLYKDLENSCRSISADPSNVESVLANKLFTSVQALDFRKPLKPGRGVEIVHQLVRETIPHAKEDYYFKDNINKCIDLLRSRKMIQSLAESNCSLN